MTSPITFDPRVLAVFTEAAAVFKPPPKTTVTEFAERERVLSTESAAEAGRYRCARAPYQRAMQDAVHLPGVEEIVFFTAAQLGKSTCEENIFAYFTVEDPGPLGWVWPTEKVAKEWSLDTLAPMLRDTPVLSKLVKAGSRKSQNSALYKEFPGGRLSVLGAASPANLRRRRLRVLLADEIDGYVASAGAEGDPLLIVEERMATFWNRLIVKASTCTIRGESAIEAAYEDTNRQKYWVPCPHCTEASDGVVSGFQVLSWNHIVYEKDAIELDNSNVHYACEHCGAALSELDKPWMLKHGEWRAERPEIFKKVGFWLSALYSPFVTWAKLATKWVHANAHRENSELLKTFVTLSLAQTWEEKEDRLDRAELRKRCEDYPRTMRGDIVLPDGVTVLTAGVDVQPDRIELEVVGWGSRFESWSIERKRFEGDTAKPQGGEVDPAHPNPWDQLEAYIDKTRFLHSRGIRLDIARTLVDSGYHADDVYRFTKPRGAMGIFASKGSSVFTHPPIRKFTFDNRARVKLWPVGVSQIKKAVYARLALPTPGPGYCHFDREVNDAEYFDQLTAEQLKKKYEHGYPKMYWELPAGKRNEALDCRVYAYAALLSLSEQPDKMLEALRDKLKEDARQAKAAREAQVDPNQLALLPDEDAIRPAAPAVVDQVEGEELAEELVEGGPVAAIAETAARLVEVLAPAEPIEERAPEAPQVQVRMRRSSWL